MQPTDNVRELEGRYFPDGIIEEEEAAGNSGLARALKLVVLVLIIGSAYMLGVMAAQRSSRPAMIGPLPETEAAAPSSIMVHVVGQVSKPGVYELPSNARVRDAVAKAGGASPQADIHAVNLAAWAKDGEKIVVPERGQAQTSATTPEVLSPPPVAALPESKLAPVSQPSGYGSSTFQMPSAFAEDKKPATRSTPAPPKDNIPHAVTEKGNESANAAPEYLRANKININTASPERLELLPGIGPAMAQRIVEHRRGNGPFASVDELTQVRGIGVATLEKMRDFVTVGHVARPTPTVSTPNTSTADEQP